MNQPNINPGAGGAAALFGSGTSASALSAEQIQSLVDQAANFNMFSRPDSEASSPAFISDDSAGIIGANVREALHRFSVVTEPPTRGRALTARNIIGERAGSFTHRWLFAPHDFAGAPDREPPPTPFDPSRGQRFVMMDSLCKFGDGEDGFRGFGAGQTVPTTSHSGQPRLLATAVGTIVEGFGRFKGHEEGTYVYCGTFSPTRGFTGNIMLRVMDRDETFSTDVELREMEDTIENPEPDVVYLMFRGQAVPSDKVTPTATGLIVEQGLRIYNTDFKVHSRGGIRATDNVGQFMGKITANINFHPADPGGGALNPLPFTNHDDFVFTSDEGSSKVCRIGSFTAESSEGRVFLTRVGGQGAIRFGGVGRILSGNGPFEGIRGLMTDNSVVVFAPHVSASVYVLCVDDADCRFHGREERTRSGIFCR
jgi:hypothetical protein